MPMGCHTSQAEKQICYSNNDEITLRGLLGTSLVSLGFNFLWFSLEIKRIPWSHFSLTEGLTSVSCRQKTSGMYFLCILISQDFRRERDHLDFLLSEEWGNTGLGCVVCGIHGLWAIWHCMWPQGVALAYDTFLVNTSWTSVLWHQQLVSKPQNRLISSRVAQYQSGSEPLALSCITGTKHIYLLGRMSCKSCTLHEMWWVCRRL